MCAQVMHRKLRALLPPRFGSSYVCTHLLVVVVVFSAVENEKRVQDLAHVLIRSCNNATDSSFLLLFVLSV